MANKEKERRWAALERIRLRAEVISYLGGKCVVCSFDDPRALQIDHVIAVGTANRRKYREFGVGLYRRVLRDSTGYQLLCANHNWIKRHEKQEHVRLKSPI